MLQNYNKILKKSVPYSQLYLNKTQIKTSTKKKICIFYTPRFFSGQNRKKSAQITRANTVYCLLHIIPESLELLASPMYVCLVTCAGMSWP